MGILNLTKLIADLAPAAIKEGVLQNYFARKVAIDATMSMYQFMIAIKGTGMDLTNESGQVTSHLQGLLSRTTRMLECGIKPVYVFDGKPPEMKSDELLKRKEKAAAATSEMERAAEEGNEEDLIKFSKRTVRVSKEQSDEAKRMLRLMGVPVVEAPCEAEAQCAALCKAGKVYASGTEDMDCLTFGTPILLRHLSASEAKKQSILEIHLEKVLESLKLTMDQFIDMCILMGCDYCGTIKGIGMKRAYEMIVAHKSIEGVLQAIDKTKYIVPENFPYQQARDLFKQHEVTPAENIELKWTDPDEAGLTEFLVTEKQFQAERVKSYIERIRATRKQASQNRLDAYFKPIASASTSATNAAKKRKREEDAKAKGKGAAAAKGKAATPAKRAKK